MNKTITKILMAFTLMLSLTTASNADFLVGIDKDIRWGLDQILADSYEDDKSYEDAAWKYIGYAALQESYAKPMTFVDQVSVGEKFGEKLVWRINFKTPFLGKMHRLHISMNQNGFIKVLQNKRTYSTLWPPGHFKGH
jgi:hypothetical protein